MKRYGLWNKELGLSVFASTLTCALLLGCGDDGGPTQSPTEDELVAHYPFTGTTEDASGHENDATIQGGVTYTTDCSGQANSAGDFNGSNAWLEAPRSSSLEPAKISLAAWVNLRSLTDPSSFDTFIRKRFLTNDNSYELGVQTSDGRFQFSINRGSGNPADALLTSTTALVTGTWYHIVGTYDGSQVKLYVNGTLEASASYSIPISYDSGILELGAVSYSGGHIHYCDGKLDDLRIYNYALSSSEIGNLADDCPSLKYARQH